MNRNGKNADVLMLECDWGEELLGAKSTRPLIEDCAMASKRLHARSRTRLLRDGPALTGMRCT